MQFALQQQQDRYIDIARFSSALRTWFSLRIRTAFIRLCREPLITYLCKRRLGGQRVSGTARQTDRHTDIQTDRRDRPKTLSTTGHWNYPSRLSSLTLDLQTLRSLSRRDRPHHGGGYACLAAQRLRLPSPHHCPPTNREIPTEPKPPTVHVNVRSGMCDGTKSRKKRGLG